MYQLSTGKYSPQFYFRTFRPFCQRANLRLVVLYVANNISFNSAASGQIQDGAKPIASLIGRILHGGGITLYTVIIFKQINLHFFY